MHLREPVIMDEYADGAVGGAAWWGLRGREQGGNPALVSSCWYVWEVVSLCRVKLSAEIE